MAVFRLTVCTFSGLYVNDVIGIKKCCFAFVDFSESLPEII